MPEQLPHGDAAAARNEAGAPMLDGVVEPEPLLGDELKQMTATNVFVMLAARNRSRVRSGTLPCSTASPLASSRREPLRSTRTSAPGLPAATTASSSGRSTAPAVASAPSANGAEPASARTISASTVKRIHVTARCYSVPCRNDSGGMRLSAAPLSTLVVVNIRLEQERDRSSVAACTAPIPGPRGRRCAARRRSAWAGGDGGRSLARRRGGR